MDWFTRSLIKIWPQAALGRLRALALTETFQRHYEGASRSRRTQGWKTTSADANAVNTAAARLLRDRARDLVRNNPLAARVPAIIANNTVGWGIKPKPVTKAARAYKGAQAVWKAWAETTQCDFDGLLDFYGLQKLAVRTIVESGAVLIRRRRRSTKDKLTIPLQLQILEPDFLDTTKDNLQTVDGGRVIRGIEFDSVGKRVAYWLFETHPGSSLYSSRAASTSKRVPAEDILHVFECTRPGQVDGVTWFAPVLIKFRDFDELDDAKLLQQKIAACFAAFVVDPTGDGAKIGGADPKGRTDVEAIEPGMLAKLPLGRDIKFADPPSAADYPAYVKTQLQTLAKGCRVTYEQLTGDYSQVNFSSAKMARIEFQEDLNDWRWKMLIPLMCDGAWRWAMEAAMLTGDVAEIPGAQWTPPPEPLLNAAEEGKALTLAVRSGAQTLFDAIRSRGYDPEEFLKEYAEGNKLLDELKIVLDSDPRMTTQVGGPRQQAAKPDQAASGDVPGNA